MHRNRFRIPPAFSTGQPLSSEVCDDWCIITSSCNRGEGGNLTVVAATALR
jgi:hypothetical protein